MPNTPKPQEKTDLKTKTSSFWLIMTMLVGALGAFIAVELNLTLALLLGPVMATMIASLLGYPMQVPHKFRMSVLVIMGAVMASRFTPDVLDYILIWPLSLLCVPLFIILAFVSVGMYNTKVAGFDKATAYFSAMPGGLLIMAAMGSQYGGDEPRIALAHILRIVVSVFLLAFAFWAFLGISTDQIAFFQQGMNVDAIPLLEVLLLACVGGYVAHYLKVPAPSLMGPLLLIAPLYIGSWIDVEIPGPLIALALLVLGSSIGSRFVGYNVHMLAQLSFHAVVSTIIMLVIGLILAIILSSFTSIPFAAALLAFSPGGIAESTLIAIALDVNPAYVAVHHLIRIVLCGLAAPFLARLTGFHSEHSL